ncbi:hypothetical protein [Rummeliibacillus stabekisii]|uniref:Uncharacterized protein n=1 Tax=Rummeliibacillus stabekisii TaxID=241244 RepID=A0A143HA67_9BACL|nr:hypothetical protein [Rummeliibacillus stabekisii]AMW98416.1 hypothetical protein ATY39_02600 [Rummeliibacillus stabekisii]
MEMNMTEEKTYLRKLVTLGFSATKTSIKLISEGRYDLALHYLSKANTHFVALENYVYSKDEKIMREEFIDAVVAFNNFYEEVLTNIRTSHSHQHSFIYFDDFKRKLVPVVGLVDSNIDLELN